MTKLSEMLARNLMDIVSSTYTAHELRCFTKVESDILATGELETYVLAIVYHPHALRIANVNSMFGYLTITTKTSNFIRVFTPHLGLK